MDLLSAIWKVKNGLQCQLSFIHVHGHQDAGQPTVLEWDATLNVEMDTQAKRKIKDTPEAVSYEIPFEGWSCYIGTRKIIKQWQLTLREHLNRNPLCQHWQCKKKFGKSASDQVDWTLVGWAMTETGWSWRKWVTRFTSGEFAHGVNMWQWKFWMSSKCPCCSQEVEDKTHIIWCPSESAKKCWTDALGELKDWLQTAQTDPQLVEVIISGLQGW